jgi:hypothetical protein
MPNGEVGYAVNLTKVCYVPPYSTDALGVIADIYTDMDRLEVGAPCTRLGLTLVHISAPPEPFWSLKPPNMPPKKCFR